MIILLAAYPMQPLLRRSRCSGISSLIGEGVSMRPSVRGEECRLDVPVTKLSVLSDSQIHHTEMGPDPDPYKQEPAAPPTHTDMQINDKINIALQTSDPSMTTFSAAQQRHGNSNQPLRQSEWWNAILSSSSSPSPSLYHSHAVFPFIGPSLPFFTHTFSNFLHSLSSCTYSFNLVHFVSSMLAFLLIHFHSESSPPPVNAGSSL